MCDVGVDGRWLAIVDAEVSRAIKRAPPWTDRDDIRGDALLGLAQALQHEERDDAPFGCYIRLRVRGAIVDGYRRRLLSRSALRGQVRCRPHEPDVVGALADQPVDELATIEAALLVRWLMRFLTAQELEIIVRHDFEDVGLNVIAGDMGLTGARISQIRTRALRRLRVIAS